MRLFFSLIAAALLIAALTGASLAYDGSYYLFGALEDGHPMVPNNRLIHWFLQQPVVLAGRLTDDVSLSALLFGLVYCSIPLLALAASWWVVREQGQALFLWAAFGVCIATLPGQIGFISEGAMVLQLGWPLFLAALVQIRLRHLPVLLLVGLTIFFAHPYGAVVFGLAGLLAFAIGVRYPAWRRERWLWAAGLGLTAALALVRFLTVVNPYETGQLEPELLVMRFLSSVLGVPLVALLLSWSAAWLALYRSRKSAAGAAAIHPTETIEFRLLLLAGFGLLIWAALPILWADALSFRFFLAPAMLPFILLAGLDSLALSGGSRSFWPHRLRLIRVIGAIFALTLTVQSLAWLGMTGTLRAAMVESPAACLAAGDDGAAWLARGPLRHWSLTPYSLILQGQAPRKVVLYGVDCTAVDWSRGLYLAPWEVRGWQGRWFDFSALEGELNSR